MKKILFGILFVFILNISLAGAQVKEYLPMQKYYLKYGSSDFSTNGQVTKLQAFLFDFKYLSYKPTGYFGKATKAAAIAYQKSKGLPSSGLVGNITRKAINDDQDKASYELVKALLQLSLGLDEKTAKVKIDYLKIVGGKVYIVLKEEGNNLAMINEAKSVIEKALVKGEPSYQVVFDYVPEDKNLNSSNIQIQATYNTSPNLTNLVLEPNISSISSYSGKTGDVITAYGKNFTSNTLVCFSTAGTTETGCINTNVLNNNTLTFIVPSDNFFMTAFSVSGLKDTTNVGLFASNDNTYNKIKPTTISHGFNYNSVR